MKVLIVGCGRIFNKHYQSIKKLGNKKITIVGICDINKLKIKNIDIKKKNKINFFTNYKLALKKSGADTAVILTPSGLHAKHILEALKNKLNVIVEKPMCLKISDGKKIIFFSKKYKKRVFVVMQNKFNLPVLKLREDIKNNKFGKLIHASVIVRWMRDQNYYNQDQWRGKWKLDGGVVSNQASHHLDLMRSIMSDPVSVFAKGLRHLVNIECEDTALIIFKFKNNQSGIMEATTAMRPKNIEGSISIMGTKGSAKIGGFALNKFDYYNLKSNIDKNKFKTNPKDVYGYGHIKFYEHFLKSITNNKPSEFECSEAIKTVILINAIYKSIETNKEVFVNLHSSSKKLGIN